MKAALRVGLRLSEYDEMTPHELNLHIRIYNERMKTESNERLTLAYLTAYWQRVKRMPNLKKLIGEERPKQQSAEQMLKTVKMLNAAFGGITEEESSQGDA